jgi:HEAT repeat protein
VATVQVLIHRLKNPDWRIRVVAADALGRIGPEAKEAVPGLIEALMDKHEFVREAAAEALELIRRAT